MELLKRFPLGCNQAKLCFTCGFVGQLCYCSGFFFPLHDAAQKCGLYCNAFGKTSSVNKRPMHSGKLRKEKTVTRDCLFECILYNCNRKESNSRGLNGRHSGKLWIQVRKKQRMGGRKKAPHNFGYVVFPRHSMQPSSDGMRYLISPGRLRRSRSPPA